MAQLEGCIAQGVMPSLCTAPMIYGMHGSTEARVRARPMGE